MLNPVCRLATSKLRCGTDRLMVNDTNENLSQLAKLAMKPMLQYESLTEATFR